MLIPVFPLLHKCKFLGFHNGEFEEFIPLVYGTIREMSNWDFFVGLLTLEDGTAKRLSHSSQASIDMAPIPIRMKTSAPQTLNSQ